MAHETDLYFSALIERGTGKGQVSVKLATSELNAIIVIA